ncbi:MAG: acetylglutamate kinase [Candidatus Omnitrophota bacterium]
METTQISTDLTQQIIHICAAIKTGNKMKEVIKKADVLIEALPYIKRFHNKVVVIKYGGSTMEEEEFRHGILEDIVFLSYVGLKPILVHGGGPFINQKLKERGKKIVFVDGLRYTDAETIEVVKTVLTEINESILKELVELGGRARSLSGKDFIRAKKKAIKKDVGFVGDITSVNTILLKNLLDTSCIPVVGPLGVGVDKQIYNINADSVASELAAALSAEKLVLLTNVQGIMFDIANEDSIFSTLKIKDALDLIKKKVIQEGMIPKVKACINALKKGVNKTHIIDGRISHALLLEIFTDKGIGTEIIHE